MLVDEVLAQLASISDLYLQSKIVRLWLYCLKLPCLTFALQLLRGKNSEKEGEREAQRLREGKLGGLTGQVMQC